MGKSLFLIFHLNPSCLLQPMLLVCLAPYSQPSPIGTGWLLLFPAQSCISSVPSQAWSLSLSSQGSPFPGVIDYAFIPTEFHKVPFGLFLQPVLLCEQQPWPPAHQLILPLAVTCRLDETAVHHLQITEKDITWSQDRPLQYLACYQLVTSLQAEYNPLTTILQLCKLFHYFSAILTTL